MHVLRSSVSALLSLALLSAPTVVQAQAADWIKCDPVRRTLTSDSNNSNFMLDPISFYFQVRGDTLVRTWADGSSWREDARCDVDEFNRKVWEPITCNISENSIFFRYDYTEFRRNAAEAWRSDPAVVEFTFEITANRRDGTFQSSRREARNGGGSYAEERSSGTCRKVNDPRPAAKF